MQGMAFGTGSGVAHRAVDSVMGPRQTEVVHRNDESIGSVPASAGACGNFQKAFMSCLEESEGDISKCQYYHDALMDCKRSAV